MTVCAFHRAIERPAPQNFSTDLHPRSFSFIFMEHARAFGGEVHVSGHNVGFPTAERAELLLGGTLAPNWATVVPRLTGTAGVS